MRDESDENTTATERATAGHSVPDWYRDIHPSGEYDGFYVKFGTHSLCYVQRNQTQLVITFDNLGETGYTGYDRQAWASSFCSYNNWSHLGVFAPGPTWFRDANLIAHLEKLRDDGFFEKFTHVALTGASMGGFAALAFSALIPEATVIAFSPQSTLRQDLAPWETRYTKGKDYDWTLPFSDGADAIETASKVYLVYDPYEPLDCAHIARLQGDNVTPLRGIFFGHRTALFLRRLDMLKPVMAGGIMGTLDAGQFAQMIRKRGEVYIYRRQLEHNLRKRGRDIWLPKLQEAFRNRRKRLRAEQST